MPPISLASQLNRLRRRWHWLRFRGFFLAFVFACGFAGFAVGGGVSDRSVPDSAVTQLYYTLGLFVLGGMDLGVPDAGPPLARALLWFAYFAAPAITASALVEGVLRIINPEGWWLRNLRGHVVLAGCGRLSMLYLARLRREDKHRPVVIVEPRQDHPSADVARDAFGAQVLRGDITADAVLTSLRLEHADRVFLATDRDFVNLDAAAKIIGRVPNLAARIVLHVSDLRFMNAITATRVAEKCEVFNTHQIVARALVEQQLLPHFERTEHPDTVVLAGFGRFGQTVLDELQRRAAGQFKHVYLIDTRAEMLALVFNEEVGFRSDYTHKVFDGDLADPAVWRALDGECKHRSPVFVLGSGDDATNLRTALWLSTRYPEALVVARSFEASSFARELSSEHNFYTFGVSELLTESMPDRWFTD